MNITNVNVTTEKVEDDYIYLRMCTGMGGILKCRTVMIENDRIPIGIALDITVNSLLEEIQEDLDEALDT